MPTSLTVADVRSMFWQIIDPSNSNSTRFLPALNEVSERVIKSGMWKNMNYAVDFPSTDGYITLPRRAESLIGYTVDNRPRATYGMIHEYQPNGPGFYDLLNYDLGTTIDMGETPLNVFQSEPLKVKAVSTASGESIRIFGVDEDGNQVFDSTGVEGIETLSVGLASDPPDTETPLMYVTGVYRENPTDAYTYLYLYNDDGQAIYATYEPTDTRPLFRRYKIGTLDVRSDGEPVVRTLCKRRFVKLISESDVVYPDNLAAIKFGLTAVRLEYNGLDNIEQAQLYWAKCYEVLNQGLKQNRGSIRKPIPFTFNNGGNVPRVH